MSEEKLFDQVAIVTGAAQGMGAAIARCLARQGAKVALCDVNERGAQKVVEEITLSGREALAIAVDVTVEAQVSAMVDLVIDTYGPVGILVNSAGILRPTRIGDITKEEWDLVVDVNLNGTFLCCSAVLEVMKEHGYGRIVNLASSAGRSVSTLGGAHYTASKAAVIGFTRAIAKELGPYGITANAICPGLINTEMARDNCTPEELLAHAESFPLRRLGSAEEVGGLALFLVSDSAYITGACVDINGGDLML